MSLMPALIDAINKGDYASAGAINRSMGLYEAARIWEIYGGMSRWWWAAKIRPATPHSGQFRIENPEWGISEGITSSTHDWALIDNQFPWAHRYEAYEPDGWLGVSRENQ